MERRLLLFMAFANDIRFALRQLRNHPGLTVVVVATLGLCIGANTAIYSVLDAVLLRPLPYPQPDRLAMVITADPLHQDGDPMDAQTGALFEAVRRVTPGLDTAASCRARRREFRRKWPCKLRAATARFGRVFSRAWHRALDGP